MTENKKECAFGLWSSPMTAASAGQQLRLEAVQIDSHRDLHSLVKAVRELVFCAAKNR